MNTVEILKGAKALIETKGWTQGFAARRADGYAIAAHEPEASCFCGYGALWGVFGEDAAEAEAVIDAGQALNHAVGVATSWDFFIWNDAPGRTKEEVLAVFDKAIAAEEAREGA